MHKNFLHEMKQLKKCVPNLPKIFSLEQGQMGERGQGHSQRLYHIKSHKNNEENFTF